MNFLYTDQFKESKPLILNFNRYTPIHNKHQSSFNYVFFLRCDPQSTSISIETETKSITGIGKSFRKVYFHLKLPSAKKKDVHRSVKSFPIMSIRQNCFGV